jgi:hypothetical protein
MVGSLFSPFINSVLYLSVHLTHDGDLAVHPSEVSLSIYQSVRSYDTCLVARSVRPYVNGLSMSMHAPQFSYIRSICLSVHACARFSGYDDSSGGACVPGGVERALQVSRIAFGAHHWH